MVCLFFSPNPPCAFSEEGMSSVVALAYLYILVANDIKLHLLLFHESGTAETVTPLVFNFVILTKCNS